MSFWDVVNLFKEDFWSAASMSGAELIKIASSKNYDPLPKSKSPTDAEIRAMADYGRKTGDTGQKATSPSEPSYIGKETTKAAPISKKKVNNVNIAGAAYIPMANSDISPYVTIADGKYTNNSVLSLWGTFELRPAEGTEIVTVKVNGSFATSWSMYRFVASKVLVKSGSQNVRTAVGRTALAKARYWIEVHLGVGEHVDSIEIETQY